MNNAQWLILMFMMEMGLPVAAAIEIVQVVCTVMTGDDGRQVIIYIFSRLNENK
jgi:hypothetical protein